MKNSARTALAVCLAVLAGGCNPRPDSPRPFDPIIKPHQASTLDPDELGIYKFVYETTLPPNKVLDLQWTMYRAGRAPEVRESLWAGTEKAVRETVLVYNSSQFPLQPDPGQAPFVVVKARGETWRLPGVTCTDVHTSDEPLALHFSSGERWTFNCSVDDYQTVKARVPDLPPLPKGRVWQWNVNPKPDSKVLPLPAGN